MVVESAKSLNDVARPGTGDPPPLHQEAERRRQVLPPTSALSILSVRWGVTVNTGNYSSARLDAEAVVPMGGVAESTLQELQSWVAQNLPVAEYERAHLAERWQAVSVERDDLATAEAEIKRRLNMVKAFCEANGIDFPKKYSEDLPF